MFNLNDFISRNVIKRAHSMFKDDIRENEECLSQKIQNKRVLVIGGAGSIGSSFIKAILPFHPSEHKISPIGDSSPSLRSWRFKYLRYSSI